MDLKLLAESYLTGLHAALDQLDRRAVVRLADALMDAWCFERQVLLMGNGGSAATASHIANDLNKLIVPGMPRLRALALTDNTPLLTAWANDAAYERVFAEQLHNFCRANDLVIAISCSGNSPNVLEGMRAARRAGARVVGLTGATGGQMVHEADWAVFAPAEHIGQEEDIHLTLAHLLTSTLRQWGHSVGQQMQKTRRALVWLPPSLHAGGRELTRHLVRETVDWATQGHWENVFVPSDYGTPGTTYDASGGLAVALRRAAGPEPLLLVRAGYTDGSPPDGLLRRHCAYAALDDTIAATLALRRAAHHVPTHAFGLAAGGRLTFGHGPQNGNGAALVSAGAAIVAPAAIASATAQSGFTDELEPVPALADVGLTWYGAVQTTPLAPAALSTPTPQQIGFLP